MKKPQGFTIIEILIASAIGLISLGVIYAAHQAGWRTFQFNQRRMKVIDKLCLSMDRIKKEVREGKEFKSYEEFASYDFPDFESIPSDPPPLIFITNDPDTDDIMVVVFYIAKEESAKENVMEDVLYKMVFDIATKKMVEDKVIARKEISSPDPDASEFVLSFDPDPDKPHSAEITLTANWTYRGKTRQESISSAICLRNWGKG